MEYHEIGERFEYEGVVLEMIDDNDDANNCISCYFRHADCTNVDCTDVDGRDVYYKLVE